MTAQKTYERSAEPERTSIGVEEFLIATYPTSFEAVTPAAARVDVSSPPAGFTTLGRVRDDSAQILFQRAGTKYHGGPSGELLYQRGELTGARVSFRLDTLRNRHARYAMGASETRNLTGVDPTTDATTIASVIAPTHLLLAAALTGAGQVVISPVESLTTTDNDARVSSIAAGGAELHLAAPPPETPEQGWAVARLYGTRQTVGADDHREFTLLGVADTVDGWQVLHYFPRVVAAGQWKETISPREPAHVELAFDVCAVASSTGVVLFERYAIAP